LDLTLATLWLKDADFPAPLIFRRVLLLTLFCVFYPFFFASLSVLVAAAACV
jgi:hypothetical protein